MPLLAAVFAGFSGKGLLPRSGYFVEALRIASLVYFACGRVGGGYKQTVPPGAGSQTGSRRYTLPDAPKTNSGETG